VPWGVTATLKISADVSKCLHAHSYGDETLEAFFTRAVREGLKGQELGDQAIMGINEE